MIINIFIQARMSSSRFPGKVLAPLHNKPIIKHLIDSAKQVSTVRRVVILTSCKESDDPIISYLKYINCDYFRGDLDNVFERFQKALKKFPCDYFVRLSADSPFINYQLIDFMLRKAMVNSFDIISNVVVRSFPKGQSIEIIKTKSFLEVDKTELTSEEKEHVFPYFYRNKKYYNICEIKNACNENHINMCIDTLDDLIRLSESPPSYIFCQESYVE